MSIYVSDKTGRVARARAEMSTGRVVHGSSCSGRFPSTVSYELWGTVSVNKSGCRGNAMYKVE